MLNQIKSLDESCNFLEGTDKNTAHCYIDMFYNTEFKRFKNKSCVLVEIGVLYGGSIRLWNSYFDNCVIYAADCSVYSENFVEYVKQNQNITYIVGNAYTEDFCNHIPEYDILIDDGPHTEDSQIICLDLYLSKMKSGGIFIIEDIQNIDIAYNLKSHVEKHFSTYIAEILDLREVKGRYDDIMLIVRHK